MWHPRCVRMHYVTHISYRMKEHKFGVTCPVAFFWKPYQAHLSLKNSVSTFRALEVPKCTTLHVDSIGLKNTSSA
jgi:hypothetical protein